MARKTRMVTITDPGRDEGKVFLLTEMPASQVERWAARALMALVKGGSDIPDDVAKSGLAGIARLGLKAFALMPFPEAEALLAEMMLCVQCIADPNRPNVVRPLVENDLEEVTSRVLLRLEVFSLHTGFSLGAGRSTSTNPMTTAPST